MRELRKQKEVLEKIFDHIPVMINFMGPGNRSSWSIGNGSACWAGPWKRYASTESWTSLRSVIPTPHDRQEVLNFISEFQRPNGRNSRLRVRDGRVLDTMWAMSHFSDGTSIGFGRDITEQKQWEDRLEASTEQLRALSASIQAAREEERTRVARLIHDELGSAFTSLKWDLESLDKLLRNRWIRRRRRRCAPRSRP